MSFPSPALNPWRHYWQIVLAWWRRGARLEIHVLLDQPADVLATVHSASGCSLTHRLLELKGRCKGEAHKLFNLTVVMLRLPGHNPKTILRNIQNVK